MWTFGDVLVHRKCCARTERKVASSVTFPVVFYGIAHIAQEAQMKVKKYSQGRTVGPGERSSRGRVEEQFRKVAVQSVQLPSFHDFSHEFM